MLDFLERWKNGMAWAVLGCGFVLAFAAVIGGYFFDLGGSLVFSWFLTVLIALFLIFLLVAIVCFSLWLFATRPFVLLLLVAAIALVFIAVLGFIRPSSNPIFDLGELLSPAFDFLNKK